MIGPLEEGPENILLQILDWFAIPVQGDQPLPKDGCGYLRADVRQQFHRGRRVLLSVGKNPRKDRSRGVHHLWVKLSTSERDQREN